MISRSFSIMIASSPKTKRKETTNHPHNIQLHFNAITYLFYYPQKRKHSKNCQPDRAFQWPIDRVKLKPFYSINLTRFRVVTVTQTYPDCRILSYFYSV